MLLIQSAAGMVYYKPNMDPMWQTAKWVQVCEEGLDKEEISLWPLVSPLTDGSNTASKELTRWLVATWRWAKKVSKTPICPPAPTILNIGQFLDVGPKEVDHMYWLLAYAHRLQCVGGCHRWENLAAKWGAVYP